jgi:Na+-transporting NADH:ubiquinone oxidoreductase subunit NqrD
MLMAPGAFFMMGTIIMIMKYFQMKKGGLDG